MRRRRVVLALILVGVPVLMGGAYYSSIKPREMIFVSFPESERWSYTATHSVFSGKGLAEYGVSSGLRTREPWGTAATKIERDLIRAGFRRRWERERFALWESSRASASVVGAGFDPGESKGVTRVSITRRATVSEAGRSWLRDHLTIERRARP